MFFENFYFKESDGELEMKKFAQRLKELREYYGMTQAKVAECLNFSSAAISNYECGAREPAIEELILLADFFQVSIDYLVGRSDYTIRLIKNKIVRYAVMESFKVLDSLNEKEIDMIVHVLANGKKYSWHLERKNNFTEK